MSNKVTFSEVEYRTYKYRVTYPKGGKRTSKRFILKKDALAFEKKTRGELTDHGSKVEPISNKERQAVLDFREVISKLPEHAEVLTLGQLVDEYRKRSEIVLQSISCEIAAKHYLAFVSAKQSQRGERGIKHEEVERQILARFNLTYGDWLVSSISLDIVNDYIDHLQMVKRANDERKQSAMPLLGNSSKKAHRGCIGRMFKHAVKIGAAAENPIDKAEPIIFEVPDAEILTPVELASLLSSASDAVLPALAILFFAGVRPDGEILRLDWAKIDLEEKIIRMSKTITKNKRPRTIKMPDNLVEWLKPHAKKDGLVVSSKAVLRRGRAKAVKDSEIGRYPRDTSRQSFATYHLSHFNDQSALAAMMGHPDANMIKEHYESETSPSVAKVYWSLTPKTVEKTKAVKAKTVKTAKKAKAVKATKKVINIKAAS